VHRRDARSGSGIPLATTTRRSAASTARNASSSASVLLPTPMQNSTPQ
jgi:hypothetical protein